MIASVAFAAPGSRHVLLIPAGAHPDTDTTLASLSVKTAALDLSTFGDLEKLAWTVGVTTADTDIDSVSYLARASVDGVNWITLNSDVNTASTVAGCTWTCAWASDSAYFGVKYFQVLARVVGDAAGSAIQTIAITPSLATFNGVGEVTRFLYGNPVVTSFAE